jgi:hypothetical protein
MNIEKSYCKSKGVKPKMSSSVSHRDGFALIVTLSALSVIIALASVLVSYIDEARRDAGASKALIQGNLYYADIKKTFNSVKKRETLYSVLYMSPIPLASEDGRFSVSIDCKPLDSAVNINWLAYSSSQAMVQQYSAAQKVFEYIVVNYSIKEAGKLEELLLKEMSTSVPYIEKEQSRIRQKNGIISSEQFEAILATYQLEADDENIALIPWKKFFVFNKVLKNPKENLIDGDYISSELISALFDIDKASVDEEWIEGEDLKNFLKGMSMKFNPKLFAKKFLNRTQCSASYSFENDIYSFKFLDIEGEVKNFEFFGKE